MSQHNVPDLDLDIFADAALLDPYPNYTALRDAAPIVRLPQYDLYVMSRFSDIQAALKDWRTFSSPSMPNGAQFSPARSRPPGSMNCAAASSKRRRR